MTTKISTAPAKVSDKLLDNYDSRTDGLPDSLHYESPAHLTLDKMPKTTITIITDTVVKYDTCEFFHPD